MSAEPRTVHQDLVARFLVATYEGRHPRAALRWLSDEELYRLRVYWHRRDVTLADDVRELRDGGAPLADVLTAAVALMDAVSRIRRALEDEESFRERARHRGVPRDPYTGPDARVPDEVIAAIKRAIDLPALIERWGLTDLAPVGSASSRLFLGRCPFHDDREPSFYVWADDPDDQHFHCFGVGCQAHGDVFDLARRHAPWTSFRDAVEGLASVAGVAWPPPAPAPPARGELRRLAHGEAADG